jgi:hypothetical protein
MHNTSDAQFYLNRCITNNQDIYVELSRSLNQRTIRKEISPVVEKFVFADGSYIVRDFNAGFQAIMDNDK